MRNLFIILFILTFVVTGCSDFLSSDSNTNTGSDGNPSSDISIEISYPKTNDTVSYQGENIVYTVKNSSAINFLELYINNTFVEHLESNNGDFPEIRFQVNSSKVGSRASFYIKYYDKNGKSAQSPTINNLYVTNIPAQPFTPFNLKITRLSNSLLNLAWVDSSQGISAYEIWRRTDTDTNFTLKYSTPGSTFNINDNDITGSHLYFYKIRSRNVRGYSNFSNVINSLGTTGNITVLPPILTKLDLINLHTVKLHWIDNSNNENYFKIERHESNNTYTTIGYQLKDGVEYLDSTCVPNREYWYRVKAISPADSSWSNEMKITTPEYSLEAPTLKSFQSINSTSGLISWSDNDQRWAQFEVYRSKDSTSYIMVASIDGNIYKYLDGDIIPNHTYSYKVRENDGTYTSDYSNIITINAKIIPLSPPTITSAWYSGGSMTLNWDASIDPSIFVVERKQVGVNVDFVPIAQISGSSRTWNDLTTMCQQTYIYRIKAMDSYSTSGYSNEKSIKNWDSCK